MSRNNTFWDILSEISSEIPKFSTDFITPDGINYKKMIETVKNANFNEMLPMWTLGTDLAMTLLKNAPKLVRWLASLNSHEIHLHCIPFWMTFILILFRQMQWKTEMKSGSGRESEISSISIFQSVTTILHVMPVRFR